MARPCIELLVLQPTSFCNINCTYCYLPERHIMRRMTHATLERVVRVVCESSYIGKELSIIWHAGEPLVLPVQYYRDAFAIIDSVVPSTLHITHSFQTNGLLLNEAWIGLIAERGIRIGVSIDGPQRFHDAYRRTRSGRGTHAQVVAAIKLLQAAKLDFSVLTVLTANALLAADEFFDFYVQHNIHRVGFNIEEVEGANRTSSLQGPRTREAYAHFMKRLMARLKAYPPGILAFRELTNAMDMIVGLQVEELNNEQITPLSIVSVDTRGNLSTFSPELLGVANVEYNNFVFGNAWENNLDDMLLHPAFIRAHTAIQRGVQSCAATCAYFNFCRGGAPANKLFENGDFASTETFFCRFTKQTLFEVVLEDFEHSLDLTPREI